jgi:hypothetical protein
MSAVRTFNDAFAVRNMGSPGTWSAAAQFAVSTWIDFRGFRRAIFLPHVGELDANLTVKVYEADDATGTNSQEVSGFENVFYNGSHEGLPGIIEVRNTYLSKPFINLQVTPGATDAFSCTLLLEEAHEAPVTNTVGTHIAFLDETGT